VALVIDSLQRTVTLLALAGGVPMPESRRRAPADGMHGTRPKPRF
jgi:hypothetical protein